MEVRRVALRLEFHYAPVRRSWLNMSEIEFSVLAQARSTPARGNDVLTGQYHSAKAENQRTTVTVSTDR